MISNPGSTGRLDTSRLDPLLLDSLRRLTQSVISMRIVSLLPSSTEIVCELGLADSLVGITHEYDYPPIVINKPRLTSKSSR